MEQLSHENQKLLIALNSGIPRVTYIPDAELEEELNLGMERHFYRDYDKDELYKTLLDNANMFTREQIDYLKAYKLGKMSIEEFNKKYPHSVVYLHGSGILQRLEKIHYGIQQNACKILRSQYLEIKDELFKILGDEEKEICKRMFEGSLENFTLDNTNLVNEIRRIYANENIKRLVNHDPTISEEAIENLPQYTNYAKLAREYFINHLSFDQIASKYGVSHQNVYNSISRVLPIMILDTNGIIEIKNRFYYKPEILEHKDEFTDTEWYILDSLYNIEGKRYRRLTKTELESELNIRERVLYGKLDRLSQKLYRLIGDGKYIPNIIERYIHDGRLKIDDTLRTKLKESRDLSVANPENRTILADILELNRKDLASTDFISEVSHYLKYIKPKYREGLLAYLQGSRSKQSTCKSGELDNHTLNEKLAYIIYLYKNEKIGFDYDLIPSKFSKITDTEDILKIFRSSAKIKKRKFSYQDVLSFYKENKDSMDQDTREMFEAYLLDGTDRDIIYRRDSMLKYIYIKMQKLLDPDYIRLNEITREELIQYLKELRFVIDLPIRRGLMNKFSIYPRELLSEEELEQANTLKIQQKNSH